MDSVWCTAFNGSKSVIFTFVVNGEASDISGRLVLFGKPDHSQCTGDTCTEPPVTEIGSFSEGTNIGLLFGNNNNGGGNNNDQIEQSSISEGRDLTVILVPTLLGAAGLLVLIAIVVVVVFIFVKHRKRKMIHSRIDDMLATSAST
eukprot:TRINITY_DN10837_c0_g1_i2.p1 TRINITY_DN10837_c0_g1~~TRINITY_DN10837_c0_g1_i2.p1  ORF type:complete len:146 (+),score=13.04 TRINITY_DN10837_c0_g1_i2:382-819(+)